MSPQANNVPSGLLLAPEPLLSIRMPGGKPDAVRFPVNQLADAGAVGGWLRLIAIRCTFLIDALALTTVSIAGTSYRRRSPRYPAELLRVSHELGPHSLGPEGASYGIGGGVTMGWFAAVAPGGVGVLLTVARAWAENNSPNS